MDSIDRKNIELVKRVLIPVDESIQDSNTTITDVSSGSVLSSVQRAIQEPDLPGSSTSRIRNLANQYSIDSEYVPLEASSSSSNVTNEERITYDMTEKDYDEVDTDPAKKLTETTYVKAEPGHSEDLPSDLATPEKQQNVQAQSKTSRKRSRKPETWTRKKMAIKRQRGEEYVSQTGAIVGAKSIQQGILCKEKCRLKCSENFSIEDRQMIFNKYYRLDVNSKNMIIFKNIEILPIKRHRKGRQNSKKYSFKYSVIYNKQSIQVCRDALCALYQESRKKIERAQIQLKSGKSNPSPDKRGRHNTRLNQIPADLVDCILDSETY